MSNISTDRTHIDADQDVPRVILSGTVTATANTALAGSLGVHIYTASFDLAQVAADANVVIRAWVKPSTQSLLYRLPFTAFTTAGVYDMNGEILSQAGTSSADQTGVNLQVQRNTASSSDSDTMTFYYQVLSTKITNDTLL